MRVEVDGMFDSHVIDIDDVHRLVQNLVQKIYYDEEGHRFMLEIYDDETEFPHQSPELRAILIAVREDGAEDKGVA